MIVKELGLQHLEAVDSLMKRNSRTLGFLPKEALRDYFQRGGALGVLANEDEIAGYILYATHHDRFRVAQLCVAEHSRGKGVARNLIDALKKKRTTQNFIKLHCRRDFPAHRMWPKLDFFALREKTGRSRAGRILVQWHLTLAPDNQLSLFWEKTHSSALNVVIDAQILFNFTEPDSDKTTPSKALYSDYSEHSLFLQITEETYNEIDRGEDDDRRERSRHLADNFPKVKYNNELAKRFEERLETILPKHTKSQESDIRQLAMTASSETEVFVTEDRSLIQNADVISRITELQILSPARLIIQLDESAENESYRHVRNVGNHLEWKRISSGDLTIFPYEKFLENGEKKGKIRERLESFLSVPRRFKCDLLRYGGDILAIRVVENDSKKHIMHLMRVIQCNNRALLETFLVADTVRNAVEENVDMVMFKSTFRTPNFMMDCRDIGFRECSGEFVKFCPAGYLSRRSVLSLIQDRYSECLDVYNAMSNRELEEACSPVSLVENYKRHFLIPIKPDYAMSLTDRLGSAGDLFGGKTKTLLRWNNVYYRSNTYRLLLKPFSRIFWYASAPRQEVVAVSRLDVVETGAPGKLFKKYKKFGVLEWRDIYELCKGDTSREIMALQFSHTFPLRKALSLKELREIYNENGINLVSQSPSGIPASIFRELYRLGFGD